MSRLHLHRRIAVPLRPLRGAFLGSLLALGATPVLLATGAASAGAATISPLSSSWCSGQGSSLTGWTGTTPNLPICGPGPVYGGSWQWIDIPGPYGASATYYNATPGFQCVELAERYLAVVAGLAPVKAEGSTVVANYHSAYPSTSVVVNGSCNAIVHPPAAGDVVSFSSSSDFVDGGDGHVAVVVASKVNGAGNGTVEIAEENVASTDYLRTLDLVGWRLSDPEEPADPEYQFPDAEWLAVPSSHPASASSGGGPTLVAPSPVSDPAITVMAQVRRVGPATSSRPRVTRHTPKAKKARKRS